MDKKDKIINIINMAKDKDKLVGIVGSLQSIKHTINQFFHENNYLEDDYDKHAVVFNLSRYYSRTNKPAREAYLFKLVRDAIDESFQGTSLNLIKYEMHLVEHMGFTYLVTTFQNQKVIKNKNKKNLYYCTYCQRHLPLDNFLSVNKKLKHQFKLCDDCFEFLTEPTEEERNNAH